MSIADIFAPHRYATAQDAQRAIEARAGGRHNLLYLDWRTGVTADARQLVRDEGYAYICFHDVVRGRMVFALHAVRPDFTAGRLVLRAEVGAQPRCFVCGERTNGWIGLGYVCGVCIDRMGGLLSDFRDRLNTGRI